MRGVARIDEMVALAARLRGGGVRVFVTATGSGAGIQDVAMSKGWRGKMVDRLREVLTQVA